MIRDFLRIWFEPYRHACSELKLVVPWLYYCLNTRRLGSMQFSGFGHVFLQPWSNNCPSRTYPFRISTRNSKAPANVLENTIVEGYQLNNRTYIWLSLMFSCVFFSNNQSFVRRFLIGQRLSFQIFGIFQVKTGRGLQSWCRFDL